MFNVLIIEDEYIIALDLKQKLKSMDCNVVTTSSGEDALKIIETNKFDLILMDIYLNEGLTGIETAVQIRNNFNIPIIYITASQNLNKLENIQQTEPYAYLKKPYENEQLEEIIKKAKS